MSSTWNHYTGFATGWFAIGRSVINKIRAFKGSRVRDDHDDVEAALDDALGLIEAQDAEDRALDDTEVEGVWPLDSLTLKDADR